MGTATTIINMSTLGDLLREAREKKNLTFDQAQKQTRINSTILRALEEGRCDTILNPTYVKSFLKKYADFLELNSAQLLSEYKRLHPEAETKVSTKIPEHEAPRRDFSNIIIMLKVAATSLIVLVIIVFIGSRIVSYVKQSKALTPAAAIAKQKKASVGAQKVTKKAVKKAPAVKKGPEVSIPKNVQLKLLLKVNQPTLVKMRTDGNLLFERVLTKGTAEMFTADKIITIYVAKGEAVEFILNGKSLGSPGRGLLKNVEITRTGVRVK